MNEEREEGIKIKIASKGMAREAANLIAEFAGGKITRDKFYLGMLELEKRYPGIGWEKSAHDYLRFLTSRSIDVFKNAGER